MPYINLKLFKKITISFCAVLVLLPLGAYAQSAVLDSSKHIYKVGENITVNFTIDTGNNQINTVGASIQIPQDLLTFVDIKSGNSIISLWAEKPVYSAESGTVTLSGGIPGGFSGSRGPIISVSVRAKKVGVATLTLKNVTVLLNDGLGTQLNVSLKPVSFTIEQGAPTPEVTEPEPVKENVPVPAETAPVETIPPENFTPIVSRHPDIADNAYFISFSTVDKQTGISHYEVSEKPFLIPFTKEKWVTTETPYVLERQWWRTTIYVKAYDRAGNFVIAKTSKPFNPWIIVIFVSILLLAVSLIFYRLGLKVAQKRRAKIHFI